MSEQPKPLSDDEGLDPVLSVAARGGPSLAAAIARAERAECLLDVERARAVAAQKSCEDWQDCASHLALAIEGIRGKHHNDEVREALAEFDRLASEATKGETP